MRKVDALIILCWGVILAIAIDILWHGSRSLNAFIFLSFAILMVVLLAKKGKEYPRYMLPFFMRRGARIRK